MADVTAGADFCARVGIEIPIVQAPMAGSGGVALAIAVAQAGGLGSLPAAMLSGEQLVEQIDEFRRATPAPLNVNFFCHELAAVSRAELEAWTAKLSPFDVELGVDRSIAPAGPSRRPFDDDADWDEIAELLTDSYCIQAPRRLAEQVPRPE